MDYSAQYHGCSVLVQAAEPQAGDEPLAASKAALEVERNQVNASNENPAQGRG
jgi:hypothetical protein